MFVLFYGVIIEGQIWNVGHIRVDPNIIITECIAHVDDIGCQSVGHINK